MIYRVYSANSGSPIYLRWGTTFWCRGGCRDIFTRERAVTDGARRVYLYMNSLKMYINVRAVNHALFAVLGSAGGFADVFRRIALSNHLGDGAQPTPRVFVVQRQIASREISDGGRKHVRRRRPELAQILATQNAPGGHSQLLANVRRPAPNSPPQPIAPRIEPPEGGRARDAAYETLVQLKVVAVQ